MIEKPQWRGEPAFPQYSLVAEGVFCEGGMTLRDYFAAKAMHALYTSTFEYVFTGASRTPEHAELMDELAQDAYQVADSMLKARNGNS